MIAGFEFVYCEMIDKWFVVAYKCIEIYTHMELHVYADRYIS